MASSVLNEKPDTFRIRLYNRGAPHLKKHLPPVSPTQQVCWGNLHCCKLGHTFPLKKVVFWAYGKKKKEKKKKLKFQIASTEFI